MFTEISSRIELFAQNLTCEVNGNSVPYPPLVCPGNQVSITSTTLAFIGYTIWLLPIGTCNGAMTGTCGPYTAGPSGGAGPSGSGRQGASPSGSDRQGAGPSGSGRLGAGPSGGGRQGAGPSGGGRQGAGPSGSGRGAGLVLLEVARLAGVRRQLQ